MSTTPPPSPDPVPAAAPSVWPPPPTPPDAPPARRPFASLLPLARVVILLGVLDILGGTIFSTLYQRVSSHMFTGPADRLSLVILIGLAYAAVYIAYRIVFLRWTFVAYKNLDTFEAAGLETTAGWAVGWFFIPIVNLFRPYLVFHELWKAGTPLVDSRDEVAWQRVPSSPLIGWWWASVLICTFLPLMLNKVLTRGLPDLVSIIFSVVFGLVSISLTLAVVHLISKRQEAKARALAPSFPTYF